MLELEGQRPAYRFAGIKICRNARRREALIRLISGTACVSVCSAAFPHRFFYQCVHNVCVARSKAAVC
jgi:hypothetical protein